MIFLIYKSYKVLDIAGRLVIPKDFRRALGLEIGDSVLLEIDDGKIIVKKAEQSCVFCGKTSGLKSYMGKTVCEDCIKKISG